MDESIRIYSPGTQITKARMIADNSIFGLTQARAAAPTKDQREMRSPWRRKSNMEILKDVFDEREAEIHSLYQKYPWADILRNWIMALLIVALFASFVIWGLNIRTERIAADMTAAEVAKVNAEHEAREQARLQELAAMEQSQEAIMKKNAKIKAQVFYGSRNFEEKYGYTKADFLTLGTCMDNRCEFYGLDLETVAKRESWWVGYYDSNPVIDKYYQWALESEKERVEQDSKAIGTDYIYTNYTERGLYLSKEFNSDAPYTWWRHE